MCEGITTLVTPALEADVNAFFASHPVKRADRTLKQHIEKLRIAVNNYRAGGSGGYEMFRGAKILWRSSQEIRDLIVSKAREARIPVFTSIPSNNNTGALFELGATMERHYYEDDEDESDTPPEKRWRGDKLVIGVEPGYQRAWDVEIQLKLQQPNIIIADSLEKMADNIIEWVSGG